MKWNETRHEGICGVFYSEDKTSFRSQVSTITLPNALRAVPIIYSYEFQFKMHWFQSNACMTSGNLTDREHVRHKWQMHGTEESIDGFSNPREFRKSWEKCFYTEPHCLSSQRLRRKKLKNLPPSLLLSKHPHFTILNTFLRVLPTAFIALFLLFQTILEYRTSGSWNSQRLDGGVKGAEFLKSDRRAYFFYSKPWQSC